MILIVMLFASKIPDLNLIEKCDSFNNQLTNDQTHRDEKCLIKPSYEQLNNAKRHLNWFKSDCIICVLLEFKHSPFLYCYHSHYP